MNSILILNFDGEPVRTTEMAVLSRRKFLKTAPALAAIPWPSLARRPETAGPASSPANWNLRDHVADWIRNYSFPFDRRLFLCPERVFVHAYAVSGRGRPGPRPARRIPAARINLWVKIPLDLKIRIAPSPDRLPANALEFTRRGAEGSVDFEFPLESVPGERVFYQILAREGANDYRPLSPPRCFLNPAFRTGAVLYALGDHHGFDDRYDQATPLTPGGSSTVDGLEGKYFHDFLTKFIENPAWSRNADPATARNITLLRNTYHLAQALAWIVAADTLPDLIVKGGDDVGIHDYRFARQGLPGDDHEANSWKLWLKERIVWGILSPLVPILQVEGNHDGGGIYHNPAHSHAKAARRAYWSQPGAHENCSPDENYGVVGLANGRLELYFLDVVAHSGADGASPRRPEHFKLGLAQTRWLADRLSRSPADLKLVAQHHVLGGWPLNPEGTAPGGYGRGPLLTSEDHAKYRDAIAPALNLDAIQQIGLTDLYREYDVRAILSNHDHIWFSRYLGKTRSGRGFYFLAPGTTNAIGEEPEWWRAEAWRNDYGEPGALAFLSAPVISRLDAVGSRLTVKAICAGDVRPPSNLARLPGPPATGDVLREILI